MCASAAGLSRVYESTVVHSCASSLPVREVVSGYRKGGLCGFPVKEIDSYRPSPRYLECRSRAFSEYYRDGAKRSLRLCVAVFRSGVRTLHERLRGTLMQLLGILIELRRGEGAANAGIYAHLSTYLAL